MTDALQPTTARRRLRTRGGRHAVAAVSGLSVVLSVAACSSDAAEAEAPAAATSTADAGTVTEPTTDASADPTAGADDTSGAAGGYTDGTYSAEGSYSAPSGDESIAVQLTVEGGTVSAVTVTPETTDPTATRYQTLFADGIAAEVVGQPLDGLAVDKVSGSSLTGAGFNEALDAIRAEAQA